MWNFILSGLRMFVFAPIAFVMAIIGILICIIEDLISTLLKLLWKGIDKNIK